MTEFAYTVYVDAATKEQANQVILERVCFEEDYGFAYQISYQDAAGAPSAAPAPAHLPDARGWAH